MEMTSREHFVKPPFLTATRFIKEIPFFDEADKGGLSKL